MMWIVVVLFTLYCCYGLQSANRTLAWCDLEPQPKWKIHIEGAGFYIITFSCFIAISSIYFAALDLENIAIVWNHFSDLFNNVDF